MKLRIQIFYCALLVSNTQAYFYPPVFWHKDSCGFRKSQKTTDNVTSEFYIQVVPSSGMNVVCPNYVTVNSWLKVGGLSVSNPTLLENMWSVDKQGYDNCVVNDKRDPKFNKLFMVCDKPKEIKYKSLIFEEDFNDEEPKFTPGHHYYFISTSRGFRSELLTRKISGPYGSCQRYHMKLHIYVCDPKKEDCMWQIPRCNPPADLQRDMIMIDGKLPVIKHTLPVVRPKTTQGTTVKEHVLETRRNIPRTSSPSSNTQVLEKRMLICNVKENGMSIQLILNFVLGGVALVMAIVIIILVCGLSGKAKNYNVDRPISSASTNYEHGNYYTIGEPVRYADGSAQISLQLSRTPPISPNFIVRPIIHSNPTTPHSINIDRQHFIYPTNPRPSSGEASTSAEGSTTKFDDDDKPEPEVV